MVSAGQRLRSFAKSLLPDSRHNSDDELEQQKPHKSKRMAEAQSEAHQILRREPAHRRSGSLSGGPRPGLKKSASGVSMPTMEEDVEMLPGVQATGSTGVIYVMDRAFSNGFTYDDPEWANFGQGAPEVGDIPGASHKPDIIDLKALGESVNEYAPTTGVKELRQAVANLYNEQYRKGRTSQYTFENVCIVPGGRAGLTRIAAVIGDVFCSYQVPEYTAYDAMLSAFRRLVPIPTPLLAENGYRLDVKELHKAIVATGLSVVVLSNPRNPTGQAVEGEELKQLVKLSKQTSTTFVLDEFYSHYNLDGKEGESLSGAQYISDVNGDPVVLLDGLTKGWRLPGWRVCWVVGPKSFISALSQSGSWLDGGASHVMQMAAIPLLNPPTVKQDKIALQRHFKIKRDYVVGRLEKMGLPVKLPPRWTFYIWLDLSDLPDPLSSGLVFFEELLKEKCIVVPGLFFDVNPSHRRNLFDSSTHHFVRLSFGPPLEQLEKGLDSIERVLKKAQRHIEDGEELPEMMGLNLVRSRTRADAEASRPLV